jgi:hypothetical protein
VGYILTVVKRKPVSTEAETGFKCAGRVIPLSPANG